MIDVAILPINKLKIVNQLDEFWEISKDEPGDKSHFADTILDFYYIPDQSMRINMCIYQQRDSELVDAISRFKRKN